MKIIKLPKEKRYLTQEVIDILTELTDDIKARGCSELFIVMLDPECEDETWCTTDGYSEEMLGHLYKNISKYERALSAADGEWEDD